MAFQCSPLFANSIPVSASGPVSPCSTKDSACMTVLSVRRKGGLAPSFSNSAMPWNRSRPACGALRPAVTQYTAVPRASTGRDSEFGVSGPPPPQGLDWEKWAVEGAKGQVPILPFDAKEVMLPGESKTLHLFEARYLSLFDTVVMSYGSTFAHVLLSHERKALAASGTIVRIRQWTRLDVGAKVEIEAIGRLHVSTVESAAMPYITGTVTYVDDADAKEGGDSVAMEGGVAQSIACAAKGDQEAVLVALEKEFWRLAEEITRRAIRLGVAPLRAKDEVMPPTLTDEEVEAMSPKIDPSLEEGAQVELFLRHLQNMVRLASWPFTTAEGVACAPEGGETAMDGFDATVCRLRALSFVGFELFESDCGQRQRALELRSTWERMDRVLVGCRNRASRLNAECALRSAFSE